MTIILFGVLLPKKHVFIKKKFKIEILWFIVFIVAPICQIFIYNQIWINMNFWKFIDFAKFCVSSWKIVIISNHIYILFTILRLFGTRESIRQKVDHGGQIDLWYWQHATNLAKATMFVVCMRLARVLVWVRGKVEQKCSLIFCVFGQARSKCSSSSTFPKSQPRQNLSAYGTPFHEPNTTSSCVLPHQNQATVFRSWTQLMSHKWLLFSYDIPLKRKYLVCMLVPISRLVKSFSMKASHILAFTLFTFNVVWGKPGGGGTLTSWLIGWVVIAWSAWVATSWGAISSDGWTRGKKPATSWGWFLNSHCFMDPAQHFFPVASIVSWASHAFLKMRSLVIMLTRL